MNLSNYLNSLERIHKKSIQTGFEKNDRRIFIEEILGQLGYSKDNILEDVPQKGKTPDLRIYGNREKKSKNTMSRFIIETKNYNSLNKSVDNIDFLQLKNYVKVNFGKIKYIASTDYISLFLFNTEVLLKERKIDLETSTISKSEIAGFKSVLVRKFDFTDFSEESSQKLEMLSHKNLFEIYDFPNPEKYADRFNIKNRAIRENFIRSLYHLMEEIKNDVSVKFNRNLNEFLAEYSKIDRDEFVDQFLNLINKEEFFLIRNLFFWSFEMNYLTNFFEKKHSLNKDEVEKFLTKKNPEGKDFYYNEYLVTCIYSIINKTLFIRILEDSGSRGGNIFIRGEKDGRYLSNGIVHERFLEGKLKQYILYIFEFKNQDLKQFHFLLKHDIYDWIISEIEESTLVDFLRVFNEIYLKELDQDILGDIYEHYLQEEHDDEKGKSYRRLLGQYYTPRPIVRLMWFLVRDILKQEKGIDIYKKNQDFLQILDPFMGSGTFLNEAVLHMKVAGGKKPITRGDVFYFFKGRNKDRKIEESLTGFEINPLSCSIADINVYFRLIKSFSSDIIKNIPIADLNLLRTNSFDLKSRKNNNNNTMQISLLSEEIKSTFTEARKIKAAKSKNYDIIISNPPYGKITPNDFMKKQLLPFAYSDNNFDSKGEIIPYTEKNSKIKSKVPEFEKNRGRMEDNYAFSYGVANELIKEGGIIAFITSNTILTLPSYKWFRKYFLENYTIHYIINFNRIAEKANSMFSPESAIATCIIVLSKRKKKEYDKIRYIDLSDIDSIKEKYDHFNEIVWKGNKKNKNDIESFKTKKPKEFKFFEIDQNEFRHNFDYEFIKLDPLSKPIEKDTQMLGMLGDLNCGISTANDKVFISKSKEKLGHQIKTYIREERFDYIYSAENIKEYIFSPSVKSYSSGNIIFIYYDKKLIELIKEKCKREGKNFNARFRDEKKLSKMNKLVITAHYFFVDNKGRYPSLNCIDGKNTYYLLSEEEDTIYYICGIMNSKLSQYYRKKTNIDNYERFPIKKYDKNKQIFDYIVTEVKNIQKLKSDCIKLEKVRVDFESDLFVNKIFKKLEIYPIEEKNEFFDLQIPRGIGMRLYIESPTISEDDKKVVELNKNGLKIICKNEEIANMIFKKYLKDAYGNLNELNININFTEMQESKFNKIKDEIQKEIGLIEKKIDIFVYALYFNLKVKYKSSKILNEKELLSDKNVKKIERFINKN